MNDYSFRWAAVACQVIEVTGDGGDSALRTALPCPAVRSGMASRSRAEVGHLLNPELGPGGIEDQGEWRLGDQRQPEGPAVELLGAIRLPRGDEGDDPTIGEH